MKFSGNMCLIIILKVSIKQDFTVSSEGTFLENPTESN